MAVAVAVAVAVAEVERVFWPLEPSSWGGARGGGIFLIQTLSKSVQVKSNKKE